MGALLSAGGGFGGAPASASGEVSFHGELLLVGDDLVDGRQFAAAASADAVSLVKMDVILEPVLAQGIVDQSVTTAALSKKTRAEVLAGSSNLRVTVQDEDPARAVMLADAVMVEISKYFDLNAPSLPDGTRTFTTTIDSEAVEVEAVESRLPLVALTVVLGLLGAGAAIMLWPSLRKTVQDEADLGAITRRAFGTESEILSLPREARGSTETLGSWLSVLLLSHVSHAGTDSRRVALVTACGSSSKPAVIGDLMASTMRDAGLQVVLIDLDAEEDGIDLARANAAVQEHTSRGSFVLFVSSCLGRSPELAAVTVLAGSTIVLAERRVTPRRALRAGLESLSVVGCVPTAIPLLD